MGRNTDRAQDQGVEPMSANNKANPYQSKAGHVKLAKKNTTKATVNTGE